MHIIQIIISIHLYRAQHLHGMCNPYLLLLLNFVLLSLMSGCTFKLAQLMLFYVPMHIMLHEPCIEKKQQKKRYAHSESVAMSSYPTQTSQS